MDIMGKSMEQVGRSGGGVGRLRTHNKKNEPTMVLESASLSFLMVGHGCPCV